MISKSRLDGSGYNPSHFQVMFHYSVLQQARFHRHRRSLKSYHHLGFALSLLKLCRHHHLRNLHHSISRCSHLECHFHSLNNLHSSTLVQSDAFSASNLAGASSIPLSAASTLEMPCCLPLSFGKPFCSYFH